MLAVMKLVCSSAAWCCLTREESWLTRGIAFRDRNAGRDSNRGKPTDETPRGGRRGGFRGGKLQPPQERNVVEATGPGLT